LFNIFTAALTSRFNSVPQSQECHRWLNSFFSILPHPEQAQAQQQEAEAETETTAHLEGVDLDDFDHYELSNQLWAEFLEKVDEETKDVG